MARARTRRKDSAAERKPKKKVSILDSEQITWIDYKDVNLLRRFMSERAKIRARRVTGNDSQQQRDVARAIRVAREMALLPYSVRQVTHRNKGKGRGDRDGGPREGREGREAPLEGAGAEDIANEELLEETEARDGVEELEGAAEAAADADEESS
jgi:small subunit ribosomal protein S18